MDFNSLVISMSCIQAAIAYSTPNCSAHALEVRLNKVSYRHGISGNGNSGLVTRWLRGAHVADSDSINSIIEIYPNIDGIVSSHFWKLLYKGVNSHQDIVQIYNNIDDASFWPCKMPFPQTRNLRSMSILNQSPSANLFQRLVMQGSLDSISALIACTREYQMKSRNDEAIFAASYIPVAVALLKKRPGFTNTAEIILCRLRQLYLDNIVSDEMMLNLYDYNLLDVSNSAPTGYPKLPIPVNPHFVEGPLKMDQTKVDSDVANWIENCRSALTKSNTVLKSPKWRNDLYPSHLYSKNSNSHINLADKAHINFKSKLGGYWEPGVTGS